MLEHGEMGLDGVCGFQVAVTGAVLNADHLRAGSSGGGEQCEGPEGRGVLPCVERQDPNVDVGKLAGLGKMVKLVGHHIPPASYPTQHGLIQDHR